MASPRFDANIILAAKRLHDNRTAASSDPSESTFRYSQTLLTQYQNYAIRDMVKETYLKYGDKFDSVMPEMTSESGDIPITNGVGTVPTDCWIVLEASKSDYTLYSTKIVENNLKVKAGRDAMIQPTSTRPGFYQTGRTIVILPLTITGVNFRIWYIQQPADMVAGNTTEIPVSPMWDGEIVERMVAMGVADAKTSVAV